MTGPDWKIYRRYCTTPEQKKALREIAAQYYRVINARRANMRLAMNYGSIISSGSCDSPPAP